VSPENLQHCLQLSEQLRELPAGHKYRQDKLQVRNILYYAIKSAMDVLE